MDVLDTCFKFAVCCVFCWGLGMMSLQYYARLKKPGYRELDEFRNNLPSIIRTLYFRKTSALFVKQFDSRWNPSSLEFLLRETAYSPREFLAEWLFVIVLTVGFLFIILRQEHLVVQLLTLLIVVRTCFFGSRLKTGVMLYD